MPADPTPAPEWAVKIALIRKWGARKAALVDDPDPDSLELASVIASVRDAALREAAGRIQWWRDALAAEGSLSLEAAMRMAESEVSALVGTAPKETT